VPHNLNVPKSCTSRHRHVGTLHLPFSQFEQILLRNLSLFRAFTQMGPLLPWQPLPLNLGHVSTAEYQGSEFIDQSVLGIRIVVSKIRLQSSEEIPLAILMAFQADANQRGDRLAHACVHSLGVPRHLIGDAGSQTDGISRLSLARTIARPPLTAPVAFDVRLGLKHIPS
jgi:hypothetical protein